MNNKWVRYISMAMALLLAVVVLASLIVPYIA